MIKKIHSDYIKGLRIGVGILFIFGLVFGVFAVGFHITDEILPGTFLGNYTFDGNVEVQGNLSNKGVATAWVNFDGTDCPSNNCTIRDSYNVKNVTYIGTGTYDIYFTIPMDNGNYSLSVAVNGDNTRNIYFPKLERGKLDFDLNKFKVLCGTDISPYVLNSQIVNVIVFGGKN